MIISAARDLEDCSAPKTFPSSCQWGVALLRLKQVWPCSPPKNRTLLISPAWFLSFFFFFTVMAVFPLWSSLGQGKLNATFSLCHSQFSLWITLCVTLKLKWAKTNQNHNLGRQAKYHILSQKVRARLGNCMHAEREPDRPRWGRDGPVDDRQEPGQPRPRHRLWHSSVWRFREENQGQVEPCSPDWAGSFRVLGLLPPHLLPRFLCLES